MTLRWIIASVHILALVLGAVAIIARARALNNAKDGAGLPPVFIADNWWGVSGALLLITGLWRAFGGLEKGSAYYLQNGLFHAKLGLFVLVLLLELWPMITLIRWRLATRRSREIDTSPAPLFARISYVQCGILVAIVFLATAIARGIQL